MTMGQNQDSTRAEIAARYGIPLDQVAPVRVIDRGISGLPDPSVGRHWGDYKEQVRRIYLRQQKFERVARKEFLPPKIVEPKPVKVKPVKVPSARAIQRAQRAGLLAELVASGLTIRQIAERLNIKYDTASYALRRLGLKATPEPVKPRKPKAPKDRSAMERRLAEAAAKVKTVRDLAEKGLGSYAISQEMNVSQDTVRKIVNRNKITIRKDARRKPEIAPLVPSEIAEMFHSGMTVEDIRKKLHRKAATIRAALDAAGVVRRSVSLDTRIRRDLVAKLHAQGLNEHAISVEAKISRASVKHAMAALGLKPNKFKPKTVDKRAIEKVETLYYDKGLSISRIGAELGIPRMRVHRLLKQSRRAA